MKWNDKVTSSSNVTSIKIDCGGSSSSAPFPVFVSSISDKTPGPLTINGAAVGAQYLLPFGDNTPLTLYVPRVDLPQSNTTNPVTLAALTYDWILPSGWKYNDGTNYVSDGSMMHRVSGSPQAGNQISVTPSPGSGGLISVRAVNNNCVGASTGPDNSISKTANGFVARFTPQLTIISDKSPNGGNFTLTCGDRSNYHFRSISDPVPAGGSFDNYVFNFSGTGIITPTGNVAGPQPATNFTGATGQVDVAFQVRYTRNGASITLAAPNIAVLVQSLPQPVVTSSLGSLGPGQYATLCSAATATFSTSVAGANSYTWTATGGLGVGSPGATTLTTNSNTITVYPGSGNGQGAISVTAANTTAGNCASPASAPYNLTYGGPAAHNGSLLMHSDRFDYETNCPSGCAGICSGSRVTMTPRDPSTSSLLEAVWKVYRTDVAPMQLLTTQDYTGSAANGSRLDYTFAGAAVGNRYQAQLQERNACGWGPVFTYDLEVIDCAGGYEPFLKAPGQPLAESAAYPNPASNDLTLEQGGGPVRLLNAQGQTVRSQTAKPGRAHLDTHALPAGLYFLEMRDAQGQPVRRQLRIER